MLILTTTLAWLWTGGAEAVDAPALSLVDAVRLALARNPDLGATSAAEQAARARVLSAGAVPNPTLSFLTGHVHPAGGDATALGDALWARSYDTVVQLGQEIELFGKRGARLSSARAGLEAARGHTVDARRTLASQVTHDYASAALAEAEALAARRTARDLATERDIAEERYRAGDISRADRDQIALAVRRFELDAETASVSARAQRLALAVLVGADATAGAPALADSLEQLAAVAEGDTGTALATGDPAGPGASRPDVAAARADLAQAEQDVRLARAQRVPDPTLVLQYEHEPPVRPDSYGVGLAFSLPVWNRGRGPVREAEAAVARAEFAVRRAEGQAAAERATAQEAWDEARARWHEYRDRLRPDAAAVKDAVARAYEKGAASLLDFLAAQRSDNDVRLAALQAASDLVTARGALDAARATWRPGDASR